VYCVVCSVRGVVHQYFVRRQSYTRGDSPCTYIYMYIYYTGVFTVSRRTINMSYNLRSTRKLSLCHIIQCLRCSYCIIYIRLKRISGCFQLLPHAIQINLFRRKRRKSPSSARHNIVLGSCRYSVRILYLRPIEAVCSDGRDDFDLSLLSCWAQS